MPLGQPIEPPPLDEMECGCVASGSPGEHRLYLEYCADHWAELPEEARECWWLGD